jgi:hypothetical protein
MQGQQNIKYNISNPKVEAALPMDADGLSISGISGLKAGIRDVQLKSN